LKVFESWLSISSVAKLASARMIVDRASIPAVPPSDPQIDFVSAPHADVARGVFETLLVADGRPVEARRHLARLSASVRALYGLALPHGLDDQLASVAAGHALARVRIEVVPTPMPPPQVAVELSPLDPAVVCPSAEVSLATVRVVAAAGAHKLIDRAWLARIEAVVGHGVRPLLVSHSSGLLETTRANVFLLRDGALATPPLDGSILAGVVRAAVLEHAPRLGIAARELPLTLDDLRAADMVLLSGSLRVLERARVRRGRRSADTASRLMAALGIAGAA
jgi:para-aminobenzoate synthetase/4-amino-4-deoxychorismate lyase